MSDFRLVAPLGAGATARVFDAVHLASNRPVAIKMLSPGDPAQADELRERFAREAIALAQLSSRHIARIVGFGFEHGQPFLVLERLAGETLDARIKREQTIALGLLGPWIAQLLVGVRDCHVRQVIHRDIKPANIFLMATAGMPVIKLIDFGIARLNSVAGAELTSTQHLLGSVAYMAPEQFESGRAVGPLTDLYAVGVVVFRALLGKLPFSGGSLDRVIAAKRHQDSPLVSSMPGAPKIAALDWFVAKATARRPEERFQSAREMLDGWHEIMPMLEEPASPVQTTPPRWNARATMTQQSAVPPVASRPAVEPVVIVHPSAPPAAPQKIPPPHESAPTDAVAAVSFRDDDGAGSWETAPLTVPDSSVTRAEPPPVRSVTYPLFERSAASTPRTARRARREALPDDESTKTYPVLAEMVEREVGISRGTYPPGGGLVEVDHLADETDAAQRPRPSVLPVSTDETPAADHEEPSER